MQRRLEKYPRNIGKKTYYYFIINKGDFHTLRVGLRPMNRYIKRMLGLIVIGVYSYLLR